MTDITQAIASLSPEKRALLAQKLKEKNRFNTFPLSFAQQRLWFLDQLEPGSPVYNIPTAVRLVGHLNLRALEQSLQEIVQRHEILRTTFTTVTGTPMQVVAREGSAAFATVDISHYAEAERENRVRTLVAAAGSEPFDLARGPLFRATLYRLDEQEHVLLLVVHHIISDGWSAGVLFRELSTLYHTFTMPPGGRRPAPLPELPIQYADFAVWQRKWLQGENLRKLLAYWKQQLDGAPPVLELPADRPRPMVQSLAGAHQSTLIPKPLARSLKVLGQQEGATTFMVLLAALQVLLHRYTHQDDISVGTPIAGRNRIETEGLIGFFINTLVMRTDLSGDPGFRQVLRRVREVALGAYAHQDLPFELLVEELQPERNMGYTPLFQVAFAYQPLPAPAASLPGLELHPFNFERGTSKFDQTWSLTENPEGLNVQVEYSTHLFDAGTIRQMIGHYQTLLEGVVAQPDQPISRVPLLTEPERQRLLTEWNDTGTIYPHDRCVHDLFAEQAARRPENVAVVAGETALTYETLNRRANQVAHYLQKLGVGPETFVGICMERSPEMVVGILGILKTGGAYVPLDPTYPQERLAFMMADTQISILLTTADQISNLQSPVSNPQSPVSNPQSPIADVPSDNLQVLCLDADWDLLAQESEENPTSRATGENLAYVMYTSGSTGRPKGIAIPHRAINRLVINTNYIDMTPEDRVALASNSAFDAATFELWSALLHGGRLVVISKEVALSPASLATVIQEQGINTMFVTTALFNTLARLAPGIFRSMRYLMFGGEAVDPHWVRETLQNGPPERLLHVYGPTESTTYATWHPVQTVPEEVTTVPIGRPLANTQTYVLDQHLQPVPVAVPGELYIGGDGLARGYLNRPDLTAERFIPNPFLKDEGSLHHATFGCPSFILYRTGDLVRYLPNGSIEFIGRIDHQVKIRGFRIEPAEIEAVLEQHAAVQDAVVLFRDLAPVADAPREKRLVAYVVPNGKDNLSAGELRHFLQQKLPEYMVPAATVLLDSLPINPNGKLDRRALPVPELTRAGLAGDFVAPHTPVEEVLAAIWASVLGLDRVSRHDSFYDLGGHSLLATQVISRLREAFQIDLPLRHLFEAPTVAGLAERVEMAMRASQSLALPPIEPVSRDRPLPLSFAQQRLWFIDQLEPGNPSFNVPTAVRLTGSLNVAALEQSLNEIIRRHESLRTTFAAVDGQPVQMIAPDLKLNLPVLDLSHHPPAKREAEVRRLVTAEALQPFDLAQGPLFRVQLLRLGPAEHVVLFTTHHIVSDEWSLAVLVRELAALYAAFAKGQPATLPELPIQYADFACWQRQWLQGETLENQLLYWRQQLGRNLPVVQLPFDHPRPAKPTYQGALQAFALPAGVSQSLKELSRREGVTLFMTLLAALQTLLHRYSGQEDIVVGTDVANRNQLEIEGLIGFFVNHLVLRTNLSGNPTFRQLLRRVREVTLGAYTHQDLPFDRLVSALQPERTLTHNPLFQVLFVFGNPTTPTLELPDLTLAPVGSDFNLAKYDLTLFMNEREPAIGGAWRYSTERFEAGTISRLSDHFETLLGSIVGNPDGRLHNLEMLTEAEKQQQTIEKAKRQQARSKKLKRARRKSIELTPESSKKGGPS